MKKKNCSHLGQENPKKKKNYITQEEKVFSVKKYIYISYLPGRKTIPFKKNPYILNWNRKVFFTDANHYYWEAFFHILK